MSRFVYLPVMGTHGFRGEETLDRNQWYHPDSDFVHYMNEEGEGDYIYPLEPFIWSSDVDGLEAIGEGHHTDWIAGGYALRDHLQPIAAPDAILLKNRNVIAHSHGLQVVAYALARAGLRINNLVTIGSPIRADMSDIYKRMRPNVNYWLHLYSDQTDPIQWLGELGDGHVGITRTTPYADSNQFTAGVGHSGVLTTRKYFHFWKDRGWFDVLRKGQ